MSLPALAPTPGGHPDVAAAVRDCRRAFWSVAVFSAAVNVLTIAGPLYMLQIYDRVLTARSVPTLVALTILLIGAYAFQGAFDVIRSRVVVRAAAMLDQHLGSAVHAAVVRLGLQTRSPSEAHQPLRDLDQIRSFLTSAGPISIVDLPWVPLFLFICFLIHPWLGLLSLAGALLLLALTILTELATRMPTREVGRIGGVRLATIEADRRNSESVSAMGMAGTLTKRWEKINSRYLVAVGRSADVMSSYGAASKVIRLLLQSAILGLGAYLVIRAELTAGAMIASSIMMGRALAPIETAIINWRGFVAARQSVGRLSEQLERLRPNHAATELPNPIKSLEVDHVTVAPPAAQTPIVRDVHFRLAAGEALGIIGQSGAGKTSLVRALVGIWRPVRGTVRIDGAAIENWDPEALGRHIGFVSQGIELFDGSIAENIARMMPEPDSETVIRAARAAGAHEMILRLPNGYDTAIGEAGTQLSAGQRQRIALARALFGDPFLIVLDEPHANLDSDGEIALTRALQAAKARLAIVVLIAHRPSALAVCDKVLFLANGSQQAFGPRDEVLQKVLALRPQPAVGANLKAVSDTIGANER